MGSATLPAVMKLHLLRSSLAWHVTASMGFVSTSASDVELAATIISNLVRIEHLDISDVNDWFLTKTSEAWSGTATEDTDYSNQRNHVLVASQSVSLLVSLVRPWCSKSRPTGDTWHSFLLLT